MAQHHSITTQETYRPWQASWSKRWCFRTNWSFDQGEYYPCG